MVGHLACIGLNYTDADGFRQALRYLEGEAEHQRGMGSTRFWWSDPSGARHALFVVNDSVVCASPSFSGGSRVAVQVGSTVDDPGGCPFCALSVVDVQADGTVAYPLAVQLDDIHLGPLGAQGATVDLGISAFAESSQRFPDVETYRSSGSKFAERSLIPAGLFTGDPPRAPRAVALITGVVVDADRRRNTASGGEFDWVLLDTYAARYDALFPPVGAPFRPGEVIQGTFWMVAHRLPAG